MMRKQIGSKPVVLLQLLKEESDEEHPLSSPALLSGMSLRGFSMTRHTLYETIQSLQESGIPIQYVNHRFIQGYYLEHELTPAEALILAEAVQESASLPVSSGNALLAKILSHLSEPQRKSLLLNPPAAGKTENEHVLDSMEVILAAIRRKHYLDFRYYDYTVTGRKKYRRNSQVYHAVPYAVVTDSGRFYCVLHSDSHASFGAYRIDKMDMVAMSEEAAETRPFSLNDWMRSSFHMYAGSPETITCDFDLSIANQVFDQFGQDILISAVQENSFTASIHASVTPTLISWLLQFYDRIRVRRPESLVRQLRQMADYLLRTYPEQK